MKSKGDKIPLIQVTLGTVSEDAAHTAALVVCDPAEGYERSQLTVEEASEVLKALGLKADPLHKETR